MRKMQEKIINDLKVSPEIDPAEEVHKRVKFLHDFMQKTGMKLSLIHI